MNIMDAKLFTLLVAIIGLIGSIVSIYQFLKNKELRNAIRKLRRSEEVEMWAYIGSTVKTYEALTEARELLRSREIVDHESLTKIQSARRGTIDLYLLLLKDAALREEEYTQDTIDRWIKQGRLENEWRIAQAKRLLYISN